MNLAILGGVSADKLKSIINQQADNITIFSYSDMQTFMEQTSIHKVSLDRMLLMQDAYLATGDNRHMILDNLMGYLGNTYPQIRIVGVANDPQAVNDLAEALATPYSICIKPAKVNPKFIMDVVTLGIEDIRKGYSSCVVASALGVTPVQAPVQQFNNTPTPAPVNAKAAKASRKEKKHKSFGDFGTNKTTSGSNAGNSPAAPLSTSQNTGFAFNAQAPSGSPFAQGGQNPFNNNQNNSNPFAQGGQGNSNPFAQGNVGGQGNSNPFAQGNNGGQGNSNPFASSSDNSNPFASGGQDNSNPFASGQSNPNPFTSSPADNPNPFESSSNPFASGNDGAQNGNNPFAQGNDNTQSSNNPFASGAQNNNPFASGGQSNPNPFTSSPADNPNPFASGNDAGQNSSNPFANSNPFADEGNSNQNSGNPFAQNNPAPAQPAPNPFEQSNPFAAQGTASAQTASNPFEQNNPFAQGNASSAAGAAVGVAAAVNPFDTDSANAQTASNPFEQNNPFAQNNNSASQVQSNPFEQSSPAPQVQSNPFTQEAPAPQSQGNPFEQNNPFAQNGSTSSNQGTAQSNPWEPAPQQSPAPAQTSANPFEQGNPFAQGSQSSTVDEVEEIDEVSEAPIDTSAGFANAPFMGTSAPPSDFASVPPVAPSNTNSGSGSNANQGTAHTQIDMQRLQAGTNASQYDFRSSGKISHAAPKPQVNNVEEIAPIVAAPAMGFVDDSAYQSQFAPAPKVVERIVEREVYIDSGSETPAVKLLEAGKFVTIIVTGDRRSGVTYTALNMASLVANRYSTLLVDLDTETFGGQLYQDIQILANEEENRQWGLHRCKTPTLLGNLVHHDNDDNFDYLFSMVGNPPATDNEIRDVAKVLVAQRIFQFTVIDCPWSKLHLLDELLLTSKIVICVDPDITGCHNAVELLNDQPVGSRIAAAVERAGGYVAKGSNTAQSLISNMQWINETFEATTRDWSTLKVLGTNDKNDLYNVLKKI